MLLFILYSILQSCFRNNATTNGRAPPPQPPGYNSGSSRWFPGDHRDTPTDAPPPYSKGPQQPPAGGWQNWRPGFWTGAAVGGVANHLWNRDRTRHAAPRTYDWETTVPIARTSYVGRTPSSSSRRHVPEDRGEGSSNLGSMRQSTGLGGSRVR